MEQVWGALQLLLEPSSLLLISTAMIVVFASAQRALNHERESHSTTSSSDGGGGSGSGFSDPSSITLTSAHALIIPMTSSIALLLMFYLFVSISFLITLLTALMAVSSLAFCLTPHIPSRPLLISLTSAATLLWFISGHWLLNNLLAVSMCIAFVAHVRLPNFRVCTLLLSCLFIYDVFWVFVSESLFGANVMVTVATQQASNPVHSVVNRLNLPGLHSIVTKLDMPVKIIFPRQLLGGGAPTVHGADYMMLGLGDMAIPGMLLALVHCFDHRRSREVVRPKYILLALCGYAVGLVSALVIGLLTRSAQPALLYLVPSTLGPVMVAAWRRGEFSELWNGPRPVLNDKSQLDAV